MGVSQILGAIHLGLFWQLIPCAMLFRRYDRTPSQPSGLWPFADFPRCLLLAYQFTHARGSRPENQPNDPADAGGKLCYFADRTLIGIHSYDEPQDLLSSRLRFYDHLFGNDQSDRFSNHERRVHALASFCLAS